MPNSIVNAVMQPWPWYVSCPLIGLTIPMLLLVGGKNLGISSSFRHICAAVLPNTRLEYLKQDDWRKQSWNLFFVAGLALGGFAATRLLSVTVLPLLPKGYHTLAGALQLLGGGFLVGFGTRYASGCTSGHSIMGLSNLQKASLVATLSFFAGGLTAALAHRLLGLGG
jgi:uncharacterized membrane protein YedE/YeeE